ncbi:MAG: AraC family transcriptional regulator [Pseudomonadales bacterium]|nr:AraC family transcriptional regulator [Pseudomonadales bacterium]
MVRAKDINIPIRYAGLMFTAIESTWDVHTQDLFINNSIPKEHLYEQEYFINFQDFLYFCESGVRLTGTNEIALEFGKRLVLPAHGAWGLAVMTSPNLYDAIMLFREYVVLELPFFIFDYKEDADHVIVEIKGTTAIDYNLQFHLEYILIAEAINFLYAIQDNSDLEIHCGYQAPSYAHRYEEIIGRKVHFDSDFTGARFHRKHLTVAMPDANHASHLMLMDTLDRVRMQRRHSSSMTERLLAHIGHTRFHYPDQEQVAKELNISSRKLRHCLREEDTNYKTIITDLKKRDALDCLKEGMSVSQTGLEIGYDDPSNFTRAFRKWYGVSPSDYRLIRNV